MFALCMGTTMHAFTLSGESEPLGGPSGGPPTGFELNSFVETDEGDLASLNPPLSEEDGWGEGGALGAHTWGPPEEAGAVDIRAESAFSQEEQEKQAMEHQPGPRQERARTRKGPASSASALQPDSVYSRRNIRRAASEASAIQLGGKGILAGIGSALLGSAAGTLVGGAQQTLSGPFALNTPQTNLTANLGGPTTAAGQAAPAGMMMPLGTPTGEPADTSHNVTGIVIGVLVGLIVLCVIGGCLWKMTKKKRKR